MDYSEFETGYNILVRAYGDRQFPHDRKELFWKRFEHVNGRLFKTAVEKIVLHMMPPASIAQFLEERFPREIAREELSVLRHSGFTCEPCRDFGYGFIGDTVTRCTCDTGRKISPEELIRQQANYSAGARLMRGRASINIGALTGKLPYDKNKRESV